jgi:hypothetical protein
MVLSHFLHDVGKWKGKSFVGWRNDRKAEKKEELLFRMMWKYQKNGTTHKTRDQYSCKSFFAYQGQHGHRWPFHDLWDGVEDASSQRYHWIYPSYIEMGVSLEYSIDVPCTLFSMTHSNSVSLFLWNNVGIHNLLSCSVRTSYPLWLRMLPFVTLVSESKPSINDLLDYCSRCKCPSGSGKRLPWTLSWVCQELSRAMIPFGWSWIDWLR